MKKDLQFGPNVPIRKWMSEEAILVVEDDAVVSKALEGRLRSAGYQVACAASAAEAFRAAVLKRPDLMILDLNLFDGTSVNGLRDGLNVLHWLYRTVPGRRFPVIVHTADPSPDLEARLVGGDVAAVFRKGVPLQDLLAAVRSELDKHKASQDAA
jgi:DNA-binding response OmpR family regulator